MANSDLPFYKTLLERQQTLLKDNTIHGASASLATVDKEGKVKLTDPTSQVLESDDGKMRHRFLISSPAIDRMGDVIIPRGCLSTLSRYQKNPVVFLNHRSDELPIAKSEDPDTGKFALEIREDSQIIADAFFHCKTENSEKTYELVKLGYLKGASIGFKPIRGTLLEDKSAPLKDGELDFKNFFPGIKFEEWELLEWSVVGIPCNYEALEGLKSWLGKNAKADNSFYLSLKSMLAEGPSKSVIVVPRTIKEIKKSIEKSGEVKAGCQDPSNPLLLGVPDIRQPDDYSCGAASSMCVGKFFGVGPETLDEWKVALGTSPEESTHPENIVTYLRSLGLAVEPKSDMSIEDLKAVWLRGAPVICPVQDYGNSINEKASFEYGHYLTVIGASLNHIFCQDSSAENNLKEEDTIMSYGKVLIDEDVWLENWHDEDVNHKKFNRYGIIVYGLAVPEATNTATPSSVELNMTPIEPFTVEEVDKTLNALKIPVIEIKDIKEESRIDKLETKLQELNDLVNTLHAANVKLVEENKKVKDGIQDLSPPLGSINPAPDSKEGNTGGDSIVPYGAKVLGEAHKNVMCAFDHVDYHSKLVEHPKVKAFLDTHSEALEDMAKSVMKAARKSYPEQFPEHPDKTTAPVIEKVEVPVTNNSQGWSKVLEALTTLHEKTQDNQSKLYSITGKK